MDREERLRIGLLGFSGFKSEGEDVSWHSGAPPVLVLPGKFINSNESRNEDPYSDVLNSLESPRTFLDSFEFSRLSNDNALFTGPSNESLLDLERCLELCGRNCDEVFSPTGLELSTCLTTNGGFASISDLNSKFPTLS